MFLTIRPTQIAQQSSINWLIKCCINYGYQTFELEGDSKLVINIFQEELASVYDYAKVFKLVMKYSIGVWNTSTL